MTMHQDRRRVMDMAFLTFAAFIMSLLTVDQATSQSACTVALVHGTVARSTPDGSNVPSARMRIKLVASAGDTVAVALTDNEGRYHLTKVPCGSYKVQVWRNGQNLHQQAVTVSTRPETRLPPIQLTMRK